MLMVQDFKSKNYTTPLEQIAFVVNHLVHIVPKVKLDIVCQTCYVYPTQTMIANEKYEGMLKRNLFRNTLEFPDKLSQ